MTEENKRLIRRYIEEVINTGDESRVGEFIGVDYTEVYQGTRYVLGVKGAIDHLKGVRHTYPDLRVTVDHQIAEGEWVASLITASGTHAGEWLGIAPTGKTLEFTGVNVDRVVAGKIVEHGGAANMLGPLLEAGAIAIAKKE